MKRRPLLPSLLALVVGALAGTVSADQTALGRDGALYQLSTMTSGEAIGDVADSTADDPLLAISVTRSESDVEILVVPGTEGPELEQSAFLAYEESSGTLFVTWERRTNSIHSQIFLSSHRDSQWSDPIPVSDQRMSLKSSPRIAITRETFANAADGSLDPQNAGPHRVQRTTLHVVWFEDRGDGPAVVYAPILLLDGMYVGTHARLTLSEIFSGESLGTGGGAPPFMPTIRTTADRRSVAVGFVDPDSGQLVTSRIALLSGELSAISDEARAHILDVGARYDSRRSDDLQRLADEARAHILDVGNRMDRTLVRFVADEARAHILDVGSRYDSRNQQDLERLAGEARAHILDVGFRLDARGVPRQAEARAVMVDLASTTTKVLGVIRIEEVGPRPLPEIAIESSDLHLSGSGDHALISWSEGNQLRYRETTEGGWGEVRSLKLSPQLSVEKAEEILRAHLDNR